MAMGGETDEHYPFEYQSADGRFIINPAPLVREIVSDVTQGKSPGAISLKFHNSIATMIRDICCSLRDKWQINQVALSGGCFQNIYLLTQGITQLRKEGFEVFYHHSVPPNDGGICLGQAVIANEKQKKC
jgi:hydrogenase maturation protein HypF